MKALQNTHWEVSKKYVLAHYPNAVCFKYRDSKFCAIFSDKDVINAKRLSNNPFEGKTAESVGTAWWEAVQNIKNGMRKSKQDEKSTKKIKSRRR